MSANATDVVQGEAVIESSLKEAVDRVTETNQPVKDQTDILEARLGEVIARYDNVLNDMVNKYSEVLAGYVSQAEPIESKLRRIQTSTFTGDQVIELLARYEQASGFPPKLTPIQITDLFDPYLKPMIKDV